MSVVKVSEAATALPRAWSSRVLGRVGTAAVKVLRMDELPVEEVGGAADVFALGAVLVAAAGGSAFGAGTPMGLMYRSVHEPPDLAAVPEGLRPVLTACLAKEPDRRPTPAELLDLFAPDTVPYPVPYPPTVVHSPVAPPVVAAPQPPPPPPSYAPSNALLPHQAPTETALTVGAGGQGPGHGPGEGPGEGPGDADLTFVAVGPGSSLLVDSAGVTLGPAGAEEQYTWAEIRTVWYAAEGPKHLRVVVHPHHGAPYPCLLAARRRARLQEWLEDLPLILECFT
ncbi:hypothetical protein ACFVUQ_10435 [Streptomyces cyaneofuscatus]|uniref:hypothetical protein n=1 Tax=Streptomyces cyaneofuscatus TaxID=66883 RepID=UPI0036DDEECE